MKNLKINYKFQIYPILFVVIFQLNYSISKNYNKNNQYLLEQTKEFYLPNIDLSTKLVSYLAEIQHALQNGVAMADADFIKNTNTLSEKFLETCTQFNINQN